MKAIIGGALFAIGMVASAAAQEQPGSGFTRAHGAYVTLEYAADRGPGAGPRLDFAAVRPGEAAVAPGRVRPALADRRDAGGPAPAVQPLR